MRLKDFSLQYGKRVILEGANVTFPSGRINHLLGRNGAGKSSVAKALAGVVPFGGRLEELESPVVVIGSYSKVPDDLCVGDILAVTRRKADPNTYDSLYKGLALSSIPESLKIGKLSDGQRQKIKLLFFLSGRPKTVVLDEITNALDKSSAREVCLFLNKYLNRSGITSINITHDIADLDRMEGRYFLLEGGDISPVQDKDALIKSYLGVS